MTQENFDIDAWKNQGNAALEKLQEKRDALAAELDGVDEQITQVKEALGLNTKARRIRIRPLILETVQEKSGKWIAVDDLVAGIQAENPEAETDAILNAMKRAVRDIEQLEFKDEKVRFK